MSTTDATMLQVKLLLFATMLMPLRGYSQKNFAPVAMDSIRGTGLIVLTSNGQLREFSADTLNPASQHTIAEFPSAEVPVDFTIGQYNSQTFLFVITKDAAGSRGGWLRQIAYSGGTTIRTWKLSEIGTGIDYDELAGVLYFATSNAGRIFRVALGCGGNIELVGSISSVQQAGPLAVHPRQAKDPCSSPAASATKIYVGDVLGGGIYELDPSSQHVQKVASYVGNVTAMSLQRGNRRSVLLAGDSSRHVIIRFVVQSNGTLEAAGQFGQERISAPTSITMLTETNVVADAGANGILVFSPTWEYLRTITLR